MELLSVYSWHILKTLNVEINTNNYYWALYYDKLNIRNKKKYEKITSFDHF